MPVVQVEMFAGRTLEQKRAMVKDVTEVFVKTINCKAEDVKIIIRELSRENLAEGGTLFIDK
ncbi:MAG TPA: 4-oxalocrotonate tautomerase [Firmicutes bacterium]|nr:4-oxalocrotonate tautomerase [Bacillota bacterium]